MKSIKIKKIYAYWNFHLICLISSLVLSELYFFSSKGVDFPDYFKYIEYFFNDDVKPSNNQGLFYYYINFITIFIRSENLNSINQVVFFNSTIQITNFFLYVIGTFGLFKLLREYGYKKETIYLSLSLMHFFPKMIEMRVILKPEIVAFAFLPWILLGVDEYFRTNKKLLLIGSLFPLSLLLTSKGSIAGMVIIFLFLNYISKVSKQNFKFLLIVFFILLIVCLGVGLENYNVDNLSFFQVATAENYENLAPVSFLYNLNFWDLYFNPYFEFHNDSFIGITLLDTFGDYYLVNLSSGDNYFKYYQEDPLANFSRNNLEIILTVLFYFSIYLMMKTKINKVYILSPFIGMGILLLNSFGFPDRNFDILKGDTVKVSYYSFFICISFIFMVCEFLEKRKYSSKIILSILMVCFIFLLGFPKTSYSEINENIETKVEVSLLCEPISILLQDTSPSGCNNIIKKSCEYNLFSNAAQNIKEEEVPDGFTRVYRGDTIRGEIVPNSLLENFINEGGYSLTPVLKKDELKFINESEELLLERNGSYIKTANITECKSLLANGYNTTNLVKFDQGKVPFLNLGYGFLTLLFIIYLNKFKKENTLSN